MLHTSRRELIDTLRGYAACGSAPGARGGATAAPIAAAAINQLSLRSPDKQRPTVDRVQAERKMTAGIELGRRQLPAAIDAAKRTVALDQALFVRLVRRGRTSRQLVWVPVEPAVPLQPWRARGRMSPCDHIRAWGWFMMSATRRRLAWIIRASMPQSWTRSRGSTAVASISCGLPSIISSMTIICRRGYRLPARTKETCTLFLRRLSSAVQPSGSRGGTPCGAR